MLTATELVYPGLAAEITFNAPQSACEYPYVRTLPGHWPLMKGIFNIVSE